MPMEPRKLQFGHGTDAVDESNNSFSFSIRTSFNSATALTPWMRRAARLASSASTGSHSATALTPWMTQLRQLHQQHGVKLQFGHGTDAVDEARVRTGAWATGYLTRCERPAWHPFDRCHTKRTLPHKPHPWNKLRHARGA